MPYIVLISGNVGFKLSIFKIDLNFEERFKWVPVGVERSVGTF